MTAAPETQDLIEWLRLEEERYRSSVQDEEGLEYLTEEWLNFKATADALERLQLENENWIRRATNYSAECDRLRSEIDSLRKAGGAMVRKALGK